MVMCACGWFLKASDKPKTSRLIADMADHNNALCLFLW